jgi:putative endonuclease
MRYVYILLCSDNSLYTGITTDLERRLDEHNLSPLGAKYTRARRPLQLVWSQTAISKSEASKIEHSIKKLSRTQKLDLI